MTIENEYNSGFAGEHITFFIQKDLSLQKVIYFSWTDNENGSTTTYTVEQPLVTFNLNPFKYGVKGFQAKYSFILKKDWNPGKLLSKEGQKPSTTYEKFYGKFKNE